MDIGQFGLWQPAHVTTPEMAEKIEQLGYSAVWLGGPDVDVSGIDGLMVATRRLVVGTSIYNVYNGDAKRLVEAYRRIEQKFPDRLLIGIGVGHPEQTVGYGTPMAAMRSFLDELDACSLPRDRRALAALGPKMMQLAHDRAGGAVPYLVTAEHTRRARAALGPRKFLAPEHKVVLDTDAAHARDLARPRIKHPYLGLVNYRNNLRRLGFADEDLAANGSDRLIDALALHGTPAEIVRGLRAHLDAGADHVQIQVIGEQSTPYDAMPDVLLQVYDDAIFRTYETLADALEILP
ncbi:TIGR03620 family F420-dependent LLM class oxidoreductase [Mycolicibacterium mucogenicum]|uniref:TIGR03620 family F420-dependent LLM class oxidoreductase n=1 Tax=Mycolicibacterium mucogenicum DSM 44124 TaxID=1226753 RepID=A0A8H2JGS6_MYCMU|nr:TIGR03620 family F420-dependent LLM class oxidoreductase [Mycolicibacterium mucogenicum]KAB7752280.1 F420-dependent oxidoreductase [Mycolicibacterium mucogenicum DSM 44124]QPG68771.1 TIGR03620 family F420-dependent LLM class oxidoreductase [Mycolicibacterium mucogenicum DSM 44124]